MTNLSYDRIPSYVVTAVVIVSSCDEFACSSFLVIVDTTCRQLWTMLGNRFLLLCLLKKMVRGRVWIPFYNSKPGCAPYASPPNSRRSSPACPPCVALSSLGDGDRIHCLYLNYRITQFDSCISSIAYTINDTFASHISRSLNTFGRMQDMISVSMNGINSNWKEKL